MRYVVVTAVLLLWLYVAAMVGTYFAHIVTAKWTVTP